MIIALIFILLFQYVYNDDHLQFGFGTAATASFKNYHIRVKQPISCENSVQYSGYIDNLVTNEHVFFIFLESRFAPKTDPVILSLNGQLGCSSITNVWFETGLCLVKKAGIETNPFSFNNIANILYVDQPTGVGYSYSSGKKPSTCAQVTETIYWFLQSFFTEFKQFARNDFHIAGTSYASHFVPSLATHIIRENRYASSSNKLPIQLASIILGNGYINPRAHKLSYAEYSCDNNKYKPIYDKVTCQKMKTNRRQCNYLLNQCDSCTPSLLYCKRTLVDPFYSKTHLNPYDIRKTCLLNNHIDSCYSEIQDIVEYANSQEVKTEYGIDSEAGEFQNCNSHVKARFDMTKDSLVNTMDQIEKVLATNIRVLVYAGDMNWYNNWYGQTDWLSKLDWIGQVGFNDAKDKDWFSYVSGQKAGTVKSFLNLSFVKVFNAGYYSIYDQPANMIDLYSRWVMNVSLGY
ncbi:Alpha/Beta hydrolase protein [Mucor mucedo]|uniref:Alpha/Beta hydrolase protein n=1 Tax=Mucor mucedo TaxID=29922 RepID=UPI00221F1802|nr:Alpha/Beta hydrolase protein [Mucor mucedo]KAI7879834.1 Alpha/Beta hydrolase protein [Mucor mucedo]